MPQRKPIVAFSHPESKVVALPGFEHQAAGRRERKRAEARALASARAHLGTAAGEPTPQAVFHWDPRGPSRGVSRGPRCRA